VAVGIAKLEFYNHLGKLPGVGEDGVTPVYPAGYVHLPMMDAEYLQQLCAEQLVTHRDRRGYAKREWQKLRERNEALDCYVYARAAATAAGLDRFEERHWQNLEASLGSSPDPMPDKKSLTLNTNEATHRGGFLISSTQPIQAGRRVIKSRWMR
jgi:phage terminase large subunit GpA-like protein